MLQQHYTFITLISYLYYCIIIIIIIGMILQQPLKGRAILAKYKTQQDFCMTPPKIDIPTSRTALFFRPFAAFGDLNVFRQGPVVDIGS